MIDAQVGDLSSHITKYTSHALTQKVFANMRKVGKVFSRVDTLLFKGVLVPQQVHDDVADDVADVVADADIEPWVCKGFFRVKTSLFKGMIVEQQVVEGADEVHDEGVPAAGIVAEGDVGAASDEVPTVVKEPYIPSLTPPTPPLHPSQDIPSTSQVQLTPHQSPQAQPQSPQPQLQPSHDTGISMYLLQNLMDTWGIIADIDADEDVVLKDAKDVAADAKDGQDIDLEHANKVLSMQDEEESEPAELQEVVDVVTTAKIITKVVTAASDTITAASTTITAADVPISAATTAAAPTLTAASRRRKGLIIRHPEESATPSTIIYSEAKSKDKGKGILVKEPKPLKKQAQIEQDEQYARELEAELNKTIDWDEVIDHVQRKQKEDKAVKCY
nr:hypothetical protein [Tanacetum cinerariifolium]